MKYLVICLGLLLLLAGCNSSNSVEFSSLNGNNFVLKVDRISEHPKVQFPGSDLKKDDYQQIKDGALYTVIISEDGQNVIIGPDLIRGQRTSDSNELKNYELDEGTFAGGRFVVWKDFDRFEAELTIYGSGVPIIKSERGRLLLK